MERRMIRNERFGEGRKTALICNRSWVKSLCEPIQRNPEKNHIINHGLRVADIAIDIALQNDVSFHDLDILYLGAFLHDIGKSESSSDILNSKEKLTQDQFDTHIAPHPKAGYDLVMSQKNPTIHNTHELNKIHRIALLPLTHHMFKQNNAYPKLEEIKELIPDLPNGAQNLSDQADKNLFKLQQIIALADYIESRTDGEGLRRYNTALSLSDAIAKAKLDLTVDLRLIDSVREVEHSEELKKKVTQFLNGEI